jgi:ABC-type multidrug transport system fused ATPase/permease subunit
MQSANLKHKIFQILSIYSKRDKKYLILIALVQVALALLDLIGVMLLGVIGSLSVYGIQSQSPGESINKILQLLNLQSFSFQNQVAILGIVAAAILILKTMISIYVIRKVLLFVSRRGALVSSNYIKNLFSKSPLEINKNSNQEIIYAATTGIENLTTGVIGSGMLIFSDFVLLFVMFIGLSFVNFSVAISIFLIFSVVGVSLNRYMKHSSSKLGAEQAALSINSNQKILEGLLSYREITVKNQKTHYINHISDIRFNLASVVAKKNFMPNLSKYVFESSLVVSTFIFSGFQFALFDSSAAIATLAIFLASATRIAPAILRIQQGTIYFKLALGSVEKTLEMIHDARSGFHQELVSSDPDFVYEGFEPSVEISALSFTHAGKSDFKIENLNLSIKPGTQVAIAGSSGAGKSTLIDLMLGLYPNYSNSIKISGLAPLSTFNKWPGAVAYVPQNINTMKGTIRKNVSLGYSENLASDDRIWSALKSAQLEAFVLSLPHGLDTEVGEYGNQLSGGQRQRLGIARALFTSPKLLILDEATSALDGETEAAISETIQSLKGKTTVVLIAHRLSSILNADKVVFMESGKITAEGSFDEVREISPTFEKQVNLMKITNEN